jgi:diguanylate cyclase (GGDEF)-like protein
MGFGDPRIRRMGLIQDSTADLAVREGRPLLIADALTEARNGGLFEEAVDTVRSAMVAPLLLGNEVLGALSLSSSRPAVFTHSDLRLLVSFAATTTAALHNAMLHAEMQKMAITDALTGLYNRRGLLELGGHEIDRFHRFESPLSAIMVDIDFFKKVNDSYGHPVGDQVLCGLAERTRMIIRLVDIFGRYGGEEFAIILPETDLFQAVSIAERVRVAIEEAPFQTSAGQITITASLGVTRAVRGLSGLTALLEQADAALYAAKLNGRNRVEIA